MNLRVRQATLADCEALAALFDGYRQFYGQPSNLLRARDFLSERLERDEATVFIAEADGTAVGFALLYPMFSSVQTARIYILNDLFVAPNARQHGAGRALLAACEAFGRDAGAYALQLETQRTNTVAQALYTEQGWEVDDEFCTYHLNLRERG